MLAVLGSKVEIIEDILDENKNNFIAQIANDNSEGQIVLSGKNEDLKNSKSLSVLIGPEGDFSVSERELAVDGGFHPVSLGPLVLRVETAVTFGLSVLVHELR